MPDLTPRQRNLFGALVCAAGASLVLLYLGVIPWTPPPVPRRRAVFEDPYHWPIGVFGLAFFFAGLAVNQQERRPRAAKTAGTLAALSVLAALAGVVAFKITSSAR